MGKGKNAEKLILILVIAALAFSGGTARLRPADAAPAAASESRSDLILDHAEPTGELPADPAEEWIPVETPTLVSAPEETPEPTPTPEPEYFTLHFIGDCTLASAIGFQGGPDGYDTVIAGDFAYPFAKTADYFADDDFTMANLECCLTKSNASAAKTFTFKTDADYAQILPLGGVEFVTLANNHVLDYGQQGYDDTKAAAEAAGLTYAGRDEWALYETESGLKIGVYAVSFGTIDQIKKGIAAVKDAGAEFVIAALHWGDEGSYSANSDQIAQGHAAIDAGADFVYGSHPHTLQPVEEYDGHYIYYSMGNWTFGGNTNPRDKDTFILRMTVERAADGTVRIIEREHIPCACSGEKNRNNYQPVPYEEGSEEYLRTLSKLDGTFGGANLTIGYSYSANE